MEELIRELWLQVNIHSVITLGESIDEDAIKTEQGIPEMPESELALQKMIQHFKALILI